ncbi:hypothetical protein [Roseateles asaccharophilus]|uniref:Uncharacterized protein n=1 Tax=Roseateles asaccharophilus TaxID=582607 RepID=A0ABU2A7F1_9BURK|nr:hypothetical protein [Roseateles asaccharophilus]MDR7333128.1 hypothetical protein [Roseateles asaccharophilus]
MNRHLATVIDFTSAQRWCDAAQLVQRLKPAGLPASVAAYAHDLGRERHDTNLSGEGPG